MLYKNNYRDESIRLKNYDYSQQGPYFITICAQYMKYLFGEVNKEKMILNDAGLMLVKWYLEMENKFLNIRCGEYVVMPNHFHCIITIIGQQNKSIENTDAHDRNRVISTETPDAHDRNRIITNVNPDAHVGAPLRGRPTPEKRVDTYGPNNKKYNTTIPQMVGWFKTMTTNEYIRGVKKYNWSRYDRKLWQKNYWDHIIRSENDLIRIRQYIKNNPVKWDIR